MDIDRDRNTKRLAVSSLILGILALGLAFIPFLREPGYIFGDTDAFGNFRFSAVGHQCWPVSFILALPGFITAVHVINKTMGIDGDKQEKNLARAGVTLNILVLVTVFLLFMFTPMWSYPQFSTISNTLPS